MEENINVTSESLLNLCKTTIGYWDKCDEYFVKCLENKNGTIKILASDYKKALEAKEEHLKSEESLAHVVNCNNLGIEAEKEGRIEDAIQYYETGIISPYPAIHAYERLVVLYSKLKQYDDIIRIVDLALPVIIRENNRRLELSIKLSPDYKDEIIKAHENCEVFKREDGVYLYNPYDISQFIKRKEKAIAKLTQSK